MESVQQLIRLPECTKIINGNSQTIAQVGANIADWLAQAKDCEDETPIFGRDEILQSKQFDANDLISVTVQDGEWIGVGGLARLVLLHAMAQVEPTSDAANAIVVSTNANEPTHLLDHCQFLDLVPPDGIDVSQTASM